MKTKTMKKITKQQKENSKKLQADIPETVSLIAPVMAEGKGFGESFLEVYDMLPPYVRNELEEFARADTGDDFTLKDDLFSAFFERNICSTGLHKLAFLVQTRIYFEFCDDLAEVYGFFRDGEKTLDNYIDMFYKIVSLCERNNCDAFRLFLCLMMFSVDEPVCREAYACFWTLGRYLEEPEADSSELAQIMLILTHNKRILRLCFHLISTVYTGIR